MSIHPLRDCPVRRLPRTVRLALYASVLAGAGFVAAFSISGASPSSTLNVEPRPAMTQVTATATPVQVVQHPSGGTLMICGGGNLPATIRDEFCRLAGGPQAQIVVIPTATSNADRPDYLDELLKDWKTSEVGSVRLLHTRSRQTADDPSFVQPLTAATGVWLTGGDQVFLTAAYLGTAVEAELKAILARGGVVAGTSAGAAVMSGVMIAGGKTKADVSQGFDFIKGAVIDQHFLKRNRMDRLIGVLSSHPNLMGLGIDEETALVVDVREHHLSVIGNSYVVACVPDSQRKSVRLQFLKSGDNLGMADLRTPAADAALAGVKAEEHAGLKVGAL